MARSRHSGRNLAMEDMEENNNKLLGQLGNKVHMLKSLAIDIGTEVKQQNQMLDQMEPGMGNLRGMFRKTMSALGTLSSGGGSCHMCYLICFVFAFFMLLKYFIMG
eukprot:CAMPEP_0197541440 /NCGR_PEP_ID=MMETSP1318-20131121/67155_1 /TAXON_ID=552666 /ORGANISM="Partenskyella glossopodia, Strain RCC365" /LENGTH=105 /DNA_ID=CAMNT_0043100611 /DNA_START=690 /DNA_END=1007 /DNA_ORIENTATION=-